MFGCRLFREPKTIVRSDLAVFLRLSRRSLVSRNVSSCSRVALGRFSPWMDTLRGIGHHLYRNNCLAPQHSHFASSSNEHLKPDDVFTLMDNDMKTIHQRVLTTLRQYITNREMYDIATYYYRGKADNFYPWIGLPLLLGKALKYHLFHDDQLTEGQIDVISVIEMVTIFSLLHDDVIDNAAVRFGSPSANVVWSPYRVVTTGKVVLAVTCEEAAKLGGDVALSVAQMNEAQFRGQYMTDADADAAVGPRDDRLARYFARIDHKSGSVCAHAARAVALVPGVASPASLVDHVARMAHHFGMAGQLLDDYKDIDADLRDGVATLPVLLAARRRHGRPDVEAMIGRRFRRDGDVEEAWRAVRDSRAMEVTREEAGRHFASGLWYLNMVAPSRYRDALEMLANYQFHRKMNCYNNGSKTDQCTNIQQETPRSITQPPPSPHVSC